MPLGNLGLQNIVLDISTKLKQKTFYANESDTSARGLSATLKDKGVAIDCTGVTLRLRYLDPVSNQSYMYDFTQVSAPLGTYTIAFPTQMIRGNGGKTIKCTIVAEDSTTELAYENIYIYVNMSEVDSNGINASNEYSTLRKALDDVQAVETALGNINPTTLASAVTLANTIGEVESDRETNEGIRNTNENTRTINEVDREVAEANRNVYEAYNVSKAYKVNNKVIYLGSSYLCIQATTEGIAPTDVAYWLKIVSKGDQGIQGVQGIKGDKGDNGAKGDTGSQGIQGIKGDKGDKGDKGETGVKGDRGETFEYAHLSVNEKQELVDNATGKWDSDFETRYTELETIYAPELATVKSQLAEIPNQAYITNKALQAELSALNVKFNPIPMVRAVGDGISDDTTAIQAAIDHIASLGGGVVLIPTGTFLISSTLIMKDKVRVIGQNSDINVYKYNQSFEGVFPTMVKLKDASNCDMVKFPDRSCSASLERMFLHGNRANNTAGRGVYFEGLISPYRSRNKLENVMISYCADRGIENDIYQYEIEIHSTMVFYSGTVLKSAAYIGGQDNNLSEFSAGYNVGDGIEIDYGGALRALNVDSFGNDGYGLVIHDAMSMSLIGITSNRNGKSNLLIYNTDSPGYPPSKLHFVNCRFFECGAGYDEIVFGDGVGTYAPNAVTFVGCDLGSISRASVAGYLVKNNYPTKRDIAFIGCLFNTINYTNIFDIQNFYTVVGCVDNTGSTVESYNKTLKQKNGIEFETLGYDYKNASAQLSVKRFNSINAGGGAVTVTLPKATKMLPGQEIIISKQDASANVVTVAVFAGDAFKTGVLTTLTTNGQTRRFITDGVSAWFAG